MLEEENHALSLSLSCEEIEAVINSANMISASVPDGFLIPFFGKFWPALRDLVCVIIQGLCLGTVDISRLNYAILYLIPKVRVADCVSQFWPIAFIHNFAKFSAKGFASLLSPVAHHVLSPT